MPALPASSVFTGSSVTEAQFKTAITDQREFLADLLGTTGTQAAALAAIGAALKTTVDKTSAGSFTASESERGTLFYWTTSGHTATLPAASGNNGLAYAFRNDSGGNITIDPNVSEQIDGASALVLGPAESCFVVCTGAEWKTVGRTVAPEYGVLLGVYVRATSMTSTVITPPTGTKRALIKVQGGGGGTSNSSIASAGAAGGYAEAYREITGDLTVVVGAGGNTSGGAGGASSVAGAGTTITATGGGGGNGSVNVSGGTGSGGDFNVVGAGGQTGMLDATHTSWVAGGGSLLGRPGTYPGGNTPGNGSGAAGLSSAVAGGAGAVIIYWFK